MLSDPFNSWYRSNTYVFKESCEIDIEMKSNNFIISNTNSICDIDNDPRLFAVTTPTLILSYIKMLFIRIFVLLYFTKKRANNRLMPNFNVSTNVYQYFAKEILKIAFYNIKKNLTPYFTLSRGNFCLWVLYTFIMGS